MTVVNAIKFNSHSGAMCCDEQTTIGSVRIMMSSDKIQKIVPTEIRENVKLEAVYGGTGTTAIGDEVRKSIKQKLLKEYERLVSRSGEMIKHFKSIDEICQMGFESMMNVKHKHINDIVRGYFNFDTKEYTQGYYKTDKDEKIDITQKELKEKVFDLMNWRNAEEVDSVFLNAAIICGFDSQEEFKICKLSMKTEMNMEMAGTIFETVGSGSDSAQIIFSDYVSNKTLDERRHSIDRVEGMIQLLRATIAAAKYNMGVGGYFNIILFDAKENETDKRFVEIFDNRAKLASEIVHSYYSHFLNYEDTYELVNELIYIRQKTFQEVNEAFLKASNNPGKMGKFLRGYKI
jgi:ATP-dependent protease HslVU (ClpYQ) peptidase subunit